MIIFEMDEKILLIFNQTNDHDVQKILNEVIKNYQRLLRKEESSYIGIGQSTKVCSVFREAIIRRWER